MIGPRRAAAGLRRRLRAHRLRGDAVECPCCDRRFARFAEGHYPGNAVCPRCGSHERHRLLRLWLESRGRLAGRVLHFAPEWSLERWLRAQPELDYQTSDLNGPADLQLDITAIALPDESVDVVIASHVLEHVEAERSALREVRRILRPGGRAIVLVPIDHDRAATYEDPAIVTPHERERAYRQHDHVRLYGRDVVGRLSAEGLRFSADRYAHELGPEARRRYGLLDVDEIYVGVR